MRPAFLIPVKAFGTAKGRLAGVLSATEREQLARWMASRVVRSLVGEDVFVACDHPDVREWADSEGASTLWGPGLGLNGAIDDGVAQLALLGYDHVVVAHADLPRPTALASVARPDTITLVPDRRRDGTNVMSFPIRRRVAASYGAGSFAAHERLARDYGDVTVEVRYDAELSLDIDTPSDLTEPLIREVLPSWLQTNPVNR